MVCNGLISGIFLIIVVCIQSGSGQYIGTVRCYVCRSTVFLPPPGVKDPPPEKNQPINTLTNCNDIYNKTTTTIKYCRACMKYQGYAYNNYTNAWPDSTTPVTIRACYDEYAFNPNVSAPGIFQLSGVVPPAGTDLSITPGMSVFAPVNGDIRDANGKYKKGLQYVSYGKGVLYVCNDGDLCNIGSRFTRTAWASLLPAFSISVMLLLAQF